MIYQNTEIKIFLASQSPRRSELLKSTGLNFEVISPYGEDIKFKFKSPRYFAEKKALLKMEETLKNYSDLNGCIITADTIVVRKGRIFEKPGSIADAERTLKMLEGKWHSVFTSYCITLNSKNPKKTVLRSFRTQVKFKPLSIKEIQNYIATKEPLDKAGGYAVQGYGSFMIEEIEGSYTNVVGLPLAQILQDLLKLNVIEVKANGIG